MNNDQIVVINEVVQSRELQNVQKKKKKKKN